MRWGNFNLIKAIAQRNTEGYGIFCHDNRTSGIIRGAHVEGHDGYNPHRTVGLGDQRLDR